MQVFEGVPMIHMAALAGAAELGPKLAAALAGPVTMCRGPGDAVRRTCGPATPVP